MGDEIVDDVNLIYLQDGRAAILISDVTRYLRGMSAAIMVEANDDVQGPKLSHDERVLIAASYELAASHMQQLEAEAVLGIEPGTNIVFNGPEDPE